MIKIGFDRRDNECRKFYYDDEKMLLSNPPKYKVWYVDNENDTDYVEASYVFYLKPAKDYQGNIPPETSRRQTVVRNPQPEVTKPVEISVPEPVETNVVETPKKKRTSVRKKTSATVTDKTPTGIQKYEYKVFKCPINEDNDIEDSLNEYGEEGWELCGFEVFRDALLKSTCYALYVMKRKK